MPNDSAFRQKYGPWALVAGASEGLGAEFVHAAAARGLNVVAVARRADALEALARQVRARHGVEVSPLVLDLSSRELPARVADATAELEIGLLVYNAALANIGRFLERDLGAHLAAVDVNVRGPLVLSHTLGRRMAERGRGGIVLMSSMAGLQGSAMIATYAATKAFNLVLGEGLWDELAEHGVDVLVSRAGATRTPSFVASNPSYGGAVMEARVVAEQALVRLGRAPSTIPGLGNRIAGFVLAHLLPRRAAVEIMSRTTRSMYRDQ